MEITSLRSLVLQQLRAQYDARRQRDKIRQPERAADAESSTEVSGLYDGQLGAHAKRRRTRAR